MSVLRLGIVCAVLCAGSGQAEAALYSNGFEADTAGWTGAARTASGTGGITSADGGYHAIANPGAFTNWGGYNFGTGGTSFQEYTTSLDIFLNVDGPFANDTRFDYTSAINKPDGNHLRDFAFNVGFYDDATGPGAGSDRFVISASNTTGRDNSFPKNPGRDPFAITDTGWYTFEHHFYDDGGVLAVDLSILDSSSNILNTWTLINPTDLIAGVGGNRYGWFPNIELAGGLAIDNAELAFNSAVPEPASLAIWGMGALGLAVAARRRKQR